MGVAPHDEIDIFSNDGPHSQGIDPARLPVKVGDMDAVQPSVENDRETRPHWNSEDTDGVERSSTARGRATLMLVVVTFFWGLSFSWMKDWQLQAANCPGGELLASLTLIGLRMVAALIIVAVCLPRQTFQPAFREHMAGVAIGSVFFVGFALQVWGLGTTTPALSAFFTCLSSVWAPVVARICFGQRLTAWTLLGLTFGLMGTLVFTGVDLSLAGFSKSGMKFGDWLTLLASVAFTGQMLILDRLGRGATPGHLTAGFFATAGLLGFICAIVVAAAGPGLTAWYNWMVGMLCDPAVQGTVLRLTLLPSVLSFYWMNLYQPRVPVSRAALIYLLEPVFAAVYSIYREHDHLTASLLLGGALILGGNMIVELPNFLPRKTKQ